MASARVAKLPKALRCGHATLDGCSTKQLELSVRAAVDDR